MLFRRKSPPKAPPAPPAVKTHEYCGETYQITQCPDTGRVTVTGHGRTCCIQAESKDTPGFRFAVSEITEYQENLFYPSMPITRRVEKTISWENSPEAALREACRLLRHHHERQLKRLADANRPSPAERLNQWFTDLPESENAPHLTSKSANGN